MTMFMNNDFVPPEIKEEPDDLIDISEVVIKEEIITDALESGAFIENEYQQADQSTIDSEQNVSSPVDKLLEDDEDSEVEYVYHNNGRRYPLVKCKICNKKYNRNYIRLHTQTHAVSDKPKCEQTKCGVCDITLSLKALPKHMLVHTGDKPYVCPTCGKQFRRADTLKEHEQIHSNVRAHVCPICKKGFKRKSYLKCHIDMHNGETKYSCHICKKSFTFQPSLYIHMKRHEEGAKQHVCKICNKAVVSKGELASHMVKHTKVRDIECAACGFRFGRLSNLYTHINRWCKGEPKYGKSSSLDSPKQD